MLRAGLYDATVLFCDIRGFTNLFDSREPDDAFTFVNSVLGELGNLVASCGGTIDKFTGDGFLAHFGVETSLPAHAEEACWCAIRMREALMRINTSRFIDDQPVVSLGIGIHTGRLAAGRITTISKSEFTVLGATVNIASRIESLTKHFSVDCLISSQTAEKIGSKFRLQEMPVQTLRGVKTEQLTYWLLPTNTWTRE